MTTGQKGIVSPIKRVAFDFPGYVSRRSDKPVINEEVIFLSVQRLPDIRLVFILSIEVDIL